jgi:hypothetical protein
LQDFDLFVSKLAQCNQGLLVGNPCGSLTKRFFEMDRNFSAFVARKLNEDVSKMHGAPLCHGKPYRACISQAIETNKLRIGLS